MPSVGSKSVDSSDDSQNKESSSETSAMQSRVSRTSDSTETSATTQKYEKDDQQTGSEKTSIRRRPAPPPPVAKVSPLTATGSAVDSKLNGPPLTPPIVDVNIPLSPRTKSSKDQLDNISGISEGEVHRRRSSSSSSVRSRRSVFLTLTHNLRSVLNGVTYVNETQVFR